MDINWKYKVDLKNTDVFKKVKDLTGVEVPESLQSLIEKANGASPDKNNVNINGNERIFGAVLSYNENETETDDVYTAIKAISSPGYLPFGIDPFGNYFCYSSNSKTVVYWYHEEDKFEDTKLSISNFISSLS